MSMQNITEHFCSMSIWNPAFGDEVASDNHASRFIWRRLMSMPDTAKPLPDHPGHSQAVRAQLRLREMILAGELPAGARIAELTLVDKLGVSRTPIRTGFTSGSPRPARAGRAGTARTAGTAMPTAIRWRRKAGR